MILVRRFLEQFRDSPTYGRDRANLISGFSIGTTGLLLNGAVLLLVLPVLAYPDNNLFSDLEENVEFGQILALTLLGGATIFSTLLIPLRLVTVFWEPRIGRYFDQIVLSGIAPLRFMIGKAASQNLFLGVVLFLLLPYLVLSLTLGGVNLSFFVAGLFLVWLYCMELAVVTLWVSLFMNELLAAIAVIALAGLFLILGCIPMETQVFVVTPFPTLMYPVYAAAPPFNGVIRNNVLPVFVSCALGMAATIGCTLLAIYLGPLYGIIRENGAFGEVVRVGDSKRKRWFRFRLHIQRSSELAFFYENRSRTFVNYEGLIRWCAVLCGLMLVTFAAQALLAGFYWKYMRIASGQSRQPWQVFQFFAMCQTIQGISLAIAAFLFSHSKNTTYMRLSFVRGQSVEVSKLDTIAFIIFAAFSTALALEIPFFFEWYAASSRNFTLFPTDFDPAFSQVRQFDFVRIACEGTGVIGLSALVVYAFQRYVCLGAWLRTGAAILVFFLYYIFVCLMPLVAGMGMKVEEFNTFPLVDAMAPLVAMMSPLMVMMYVYGGHVGSPFPQVMSTIPFYVGHLTLFCLLLLGIRGRSRTLRPMYFAAPDLPSQSPEHAHG